MAAGEWWYIREGKRQGPYSGADLERHLAEKEISPNTKVWRKGMERWTRMADVLDLLEIIKEPPPPRESPARGDGAPQTLKPAEPWSRYFARSIDLTVFGFAGFWALCATLGPNANVLTLLLVGCLVVFPFSLLIEVPFMAATGTTIGKWIFGITVRRADGGRLTIAELFRRNMTLLVHGYWMGIPVACLIPIIKNYLVVKKGKRCRWDEIPMHDVLQRPISRCRWLVGAAISLYVAPAAMGAIFGNPLSEQISRQQIQSASPATPRPAVTATWVNPLTNGSATLFSGWRSAPERVNGERDVFWFENSNSAVILGREVLDAIDLGIYIETFQTITNLGQLVDKKVEIDSTGITYYTITHNKIVNGARVRIDSKFWQTSSTNYWRSVVISPLNDEKSRAEARALAAAVEKTSLIERKAPTHTDGSLR